MPYTGPGPDDDAGGQGYDPATMGGTFGDWQANRRAWRSTFNPNDPNGWRARRNEAEDMQILLAGPQSDAGWGQLLNSLGIFNAKDQRQSRYRSLSAARDGNILYNTNFALDGQGNAADIATSDQNVNGVFRPMNDNLRKQAGMSFYDQLYGNLGLGSSQRWQRQGLTGMPTDPATGLYIQRNPDGSTAYYDQQMFRVDPRTRRRQGHYQMPGVTLGSFLGGPNAG
jgi:hypothetical protein